MYFHALACDYDGTLAHDGIVAPEVVAQLRRFKESGRRLILVTGRRLNDLIQTFPQVDIFDRIVAENGALLYNPSTKEERVLALPPPVQLVEQLRAKGVDPLDCGKVIVATWCPHEAILLQTIHELGLEMQVIFNKGAVMAMPSGVNKATGLEQALMELGLSRHNTVTIGDAENDHAMFSFCECSAAVANALPMVREHADLITRGDHGEGVCELMTMLLDDELSVVHRTSGRHEVCIGTTVDHQPVTFNTDCGRILICGPSGSGKTLLAMAMVEQIGALDYQFCLIDPEHDFADLAGAVVLGDTQRGPTLPEISQALSDPQVNVVINLLGVAHQDRPGMFVRLTSPIRQLMNLYGRPHWFVADEAQYLLPSRGPMTSGVDEVLAFGHSLLITVYPEHIQRKVLEAVDIVIATPAEPQETIRRFCQAIGEDEPAITGWDQSPHRYVIWDRRNGMPPTAFHATRPRQEHHRHLRKYAEGDLGAYHSFYFTGPENKLNLKAQNLQMFIHLLNGIDDGTWLYHLRQHDYSRWFRGSIRDESLANEATKIENDFRLSARETRALIVSAIQSRYSAPV